MDFGKCLVARSKGTKRTGGNLDGRRERGEKRKELNQNNLRMIEPDSLATRLSPSFSLSLLLSPYPAGRMTATRDKEDRIEHSLSHWTFAPTFIHCHTAIATAVGTLVETVHFVHLV